MADPLRPVLLPSGCPERSASAPAQAKSTGAGLTMPAQSKRIRPKVPPAKSTQKNLWVKVVWGDYSKPGVRRTQKQSVPLPAAALARSGWEYLLSSAWRRWWGHLAAVLRLPCEGKQRENTDLISVMTPENTWGNDMKLCQEEFGLEVLQPDDGHCNRLPRKVLMIL